MDENENGQRTFRSPGGGWPDSYRERWDELLYYRSFTNIDLDRVIEEAQARKAGIDTGSALVPAKE